MRAGLRAITSIEVSKIDAGFVKAERILLATYDGFRTEEVPADLRSVLHDMRVYRDRCVDDMTFRATEDFREAMALVEWAVGERERQALKPAAATGVRPATPSSPASSPSVVVKSARPRGLSSEQQAAVLKCIAEADGAIRSADIRATVKLDNRLRPALTKFLKWAEASGMVRTSGQRYGFQVEATDQLKKG